MISDFFELTILNNTIQQYLVFLVVSILGILLTKVLLSKILVARWRVYAEMTRTNVDNFLVRVVDRVVIPLLYFGAFYLGTRALDLGEVLNKIIKVTGVSLLSFLGIRFLVSLIEYALQSHWKVREDYAQRQRSLGGLLIVIKALIWGFGVFFLLDNLGFKVSTLVAGLGVGGIAVALAGQTVLADLFAYFAILFDKPFEVGDFLIIDGFQGSVENIGVKTTRIRSLGGEQLIFPNNDLAKTRIRNYKRMEQRRVAFKIGLVYQTPPEKLEKVPILVKDIVTAIEGATFDRAHFFAYGDFSLVFEIVYNVLSPDYNVYMDIQQNINLRLYEELRKEGIEFAYPTQTVLLAGQPLS